jgi:hypothetical protein
MAEKFIQRAIKRPGSFTAQAKRAGVTVPEFTRHVIANPKKFSATTRRRAFLARTLKKLRK